MFVWDRLTIYKMKKLVAGGLSQALCILLDTGNVYTLAGKGYTVKADDAYIFRNALAHTDGPGICPESTPVTYGKNTVKLKAFYYKVTYGLTAVGKTILGWLHFNDVLGGKLYPTPSELIEKSLLSFFTPDTLSGAHDHNGTFAILIQQRSCRKTA